MSWQGAKVLSDEVRKRIRNWVILATGLDSNSVFWGNTNGPAPQSFPWVSLSVVTQQQSGMADSRTIDEDEVETTTSTIEMTVWARCFGSDPGMAVGVGRCIEAWCVLPLDRQGAGELTLQVIKPTRVMPQLRGTVQQHMALVEICAWYTETLTEEQVGYIQYATGTVTLQNEPEPDIVVDIEAGTPPEP